LPVTIPVANPHTPIGGAGDANGIASPDPLCDYPTLAGAREADAQSLNDRVAALIRSTPKPKPEIDPFRTVMPSVSFPAAIAIVGLPGAYPLGLLIAKPARSIVTKLAVIVRHVPLELVKVRFLTSLYEPG
jgi:hypothetical protein